MALVVADICASDAVILRAIAAELNDRNMLTRRNRRRHVSTVQELLVRLTLRPMVCVGRG
jgi:hypothetical protein